MLLKVFVAKKESIINRKSCSPFLYPFLLQHTNKEEIEKLYGKWVNDVSLVDNVEECDIVMPAHHINHYYTNGIVDELKAINRIAVDNNKLTICFTVGDWGITPKLENFHLYRNGGYLSKNKGNEFCYPFILGVDPVERFYNNQLQFNSKTEKPIIGFCGRASDNNLDKIKDILKNMRRLLLHTAGKWHEDVDLFYGSSSKRFAMLQKIKQHSNVDTNFIYHKGFVGGLNSFKNAGEVNKIFYKNIQDSQYIYCYRGWGNFSLRLYETMASGRIPVIVRSDNNLPCSDVIDWNIFPNVQENEYDNIAEIVSSFHASISENAFIELQAGARKIWEKYLTYNAFMLYMCKKYIALK